MVMRTRGAQRSERKSLAFLRRFFCLNFLKESLLDMTSSLAEVWREGWYNREDMKDEVNEIEPVKRWIGRWLLDMSSQLLKLNPVPAVRRVVDRREMTGKKTRVMPGELAVSKEHIVPAEMVKFSRKRYGDDVVVYLRDKAPKANGEGIFYLIKLLEEDGSKKGRPVGIAEISSREKRGENRGRVAWYVRESKEARDRWKDRYQELFVAQFGEKALDRFLNRD